MDIPREVVLDLLPLYLAGEGSPATRELVESYLQKDPELAESTRRQWAENLALPGHSELPLDLELKSLHRTRKLLGWQRWLLGIGIGLVVLLFSDQNSWQGAHDALFSNDTPLTRNYPPLFGIFVAICAVCWIAYLLIRRRLRTS